jgi:hypothetical protein
MTKRSGEQVIDILTGEELHTEGQAPLEPYTVVLTGTHP